MADYNIQMQYYNGSSYDTLYPQTIISNDNFDGVLSVEKGGTGSSSEQEALFKFITASTSTESPVNDGYIAYRFMSNNVTYKTQIRDLLMNTGVVSYKGTGQSSVSIQFSNYLPNYSSYIFFIISTNTFIILRKPNGTGTQIVSAYQIESSSIEIFNTYINIDNNLIEFSTFPTNFHLNSNNVEYVIGYINNK